MRSHDLGWHKLNHPTGTGLADPRLGKPLRIAIMKFGGPHALFIQPESISSMNTLIGIMEIGIKLEQGDCNFPSHRSWMGRLKGARDSTKESTTNMQQMKIDHPDNILHARNAKV